MEKENWIAQQLQVIEDETSEFSFSKVNLLKITSLEKLIKKTPEFAEHCSTCKANLSELEQMVHQVSKLDDSYVRQPYEKKFNEMRRHFQKEHGYFDPFHYVSRWAFLAAVIGAIIALAISYFWKQQIISDFLLMGAFIGLAVGYISGSLKDKTIRKAGKLI